MKQVTTAIVGGGLTGLAIAYHLQKANHDYLLVEARDRLGGRIHSLDVEGERFDLGPSWIWPGQTRVFQILQDLGLDIFEQWSDGAQLYEQPDGQVLLNQGFMSMVGSYRILGGSTALTEAIAHYLDPERVLTGQRVIGVTNDPEIHLSEDKAVKANRVILAMPPRLMARLAFQPALRSDQTKALNAVPTWMAAHATFVAVYDRPFWRENGLSGDASCRLGPMVEIHDASPGNGGMGALFGFIGIPAHQRAQLGASLTDMALAQLVNLFGPMAGDPVAASLCDWSDDIFTATAADQNPPAGHPAYTKPATLTYLWDGKLVLTGTEFAPDNGGLIEGALAAAEETANAILSD